MPHVTAALLHRLDAELVVVWESSRLEGFLFVFRFVLFFAGGGVVVVVVFVLPLLTPQIIIMQRSLLRML